ncbi:MAG: hypothetical protein ACLR44_08020 [Clostridia bacterium]
MEAQKQKSFVIKLKKILDKLIFMMEIRSQFFMEQINLLAPLAA